MDTVQENTTSKENLTQQTW